MRLVKRIFGEAIYPALCVVGIGYNVLMTLNAPEGVRMNAMLQDHIDREAKVLADLQAEHSRLSDRADRLMSASLDADLLDERVRSVLGLVQDGELMVRMDDLDRLAEHSRSQPNGPVDSFQLASLIQEVSTEPLSY